MKRFVATVTIVACFGFIAAALAEDFGYTKTQGEVMECSPPKFMLVADVDMEAKTLTGMLTKERYDPELVVFAYHMTFKLSEVKVTQPQPQASCRTLLGQVCFIWQGGSGFLKTTNRDLSVFNFLRLPNKVA